MEVVCIYLNGCVCCRSSLNRRQHVFHLLKLLYLNDQLKTRARIEFTPADFNDMLKRWVEGESSRAAAPTWLVPFEEIELQTEVGSGSNGTVYKGVWRMSPVSVKVVLLDKNAKSFLMESKELKTLISLRHPNVVLLMGVSISQAHVAFIYPYYSSNLQILILNTELTNKQKLRISLDIAKGLNYIHRENRVHGDIKSLNCLVDTSYIVSIADFVLSELIP